MSQFQLREPAVCLQALGKIIGGDSAYGPIEERDAAHSEDCKASQEGVR